LPRQRLGDPFFISPEHFGELLRRAAEYNQLPVAGQGEVIYLTPLPGTTSGVPHAAGTRTSDTARSISRRK